MVSIYDRPSEHLYYQGIRVYSLRYPARFTFDFKAPYVQLTEDRTAGNVWNLMYHLANIIQTKISSRDVIYKMLNKSSRQSEEAGVPTFETHELNFDYMTSTSDTFRVAAERLVSSGTAGKSLTGYWGASSRYEQEKLTRSVQLSAAKWKLISGFCDAFFSAGTEDQRAAIEDLRRKLWDIV